MSKETDVNEIKKETAVSEQGVGASKKRNDNEELTKAVKALIARVDRQYKLNVKICKWAIGVLLIIISCLISIAFYTFVDATTVG